MRTLVGWLGAVAVTAALAGCAGKSPPVRAVAPPAPSDAALEASLEVCREAYRRLDERVEDAGVGDAQAARIPGFPYLRIDRFLAADAIRPDASDVDFGVWVAHLRDRDLEARRFEVANLEGKADAARLEQLARCSTQLMEAELTSREARAKLLSVASVPDDYDVGMRVLGLYPFTSLPFKAGVGDLHERMQQSFSTPLEKLPVSGRLLRYRPPPAAVALPADVAAGILAAAEVDPAGIPRLDEADARRLLAAFAPVYAIDVTGPDDRIGIPYWSADGLPGVDVAEPVVYTRIAHTRFEGRTLVQLVYSIWFPARPAEGDFDLLAGRLDGITLRVTLDVDGRPLVYDSMHNCGCYHLFVPGTRLERRPPSQAYEEPLLVPQRLQPGSGRLVVRIAHGSHYVQRMYFDDAALEGTVYAFRDDDALRSLPLAGGGRRSLFAPDGVVPGTERGERWFFWPMGIAEPGAMRQWGRHATAFVGRRHFDDPDLLERYFRRAD